MARFGGIGLGLGVVIACFFGLALAACDEGNETQQPKQSEAPAPPLQTAGTPSQQPAADDIVLPERAKIAEDWSKFLPEVYKALTDCLAADPSPPAYAVSVVPQNRGMVLVRMVGKDDARRDCEISSLGGKPESIRPMDTGEGIAGPSFIPAVLGEPKSQCIEAASITTKAGALLGWLAWAKPDCA